MGASIGSSLVCVVQARIGNARVAISGQGRLAQRRSLDSPASVAVRSMACTTFCLVSFDAQKLHGGRSAAAGVLVVMYKTRIWMAKCCRMCMRRHLTHLHAG